MNNRIKILRKNLNLTQKEFAEQIGLTQNAITFLEKPNFTVTAQNIKLICSQFNVNEEWLKYGKGEMFIKFDEKLNDFLKIFKKLSPPLQDFLLTTAKNLLDTQNKMKN